MQRNNPYVFIFVASNSFRVVSCMLERPPFRPSIIQDVFVTADQCSSSRPSSDPTASPPPTLRFRPRNKNALDGPNPVTSLQPGEWCKMPDMTDIEVRLTSMKDYHSVALSHRQRDEILLTKPDLPPFTANPPFSIVLAFRSSNCLRGPLPSRRRDRRTISRRDQTRLRPTGGARTSARRCRFPHGAA